MDITLLRKSTRSTNEIAITCDEQFSHIFNLQPLLLPKGKEEQYLHDNAISYGQRLFQALFPAGSPARLALDAMPERIVLTATDEETDTIAWEYLYGPDGFVVCDYPFVRGLPKEQRKSAPSLDTGLHIIAVPSQPLSTTIPALNIDAEWMRLKESASSSSLTLERIRPPTLDKVRQAVAGQRHRVLHFMGHGGQGKDGAVLYFEQDNGAAELVSAKGLVQRVRQNVFLVTLNACVSASPGLTTFSNLAATLVRQHIPYALGMRLSILDEDALTFSRAFYSDLARGVPVEEALFQARLTLKEKSQQVWSIGLPVLYTSLLETAAGFVRQEGRPIVADHQPRMDVSALPRAEGAFQGRIDDLLRLGMLLTGDRRPRVLTIHGGGGQGKTALAREVVERFAYAWPSGVWAISLENLPERSLFTSSLARFLGIETQQIGDPAEIERLLHAQLRTRRLLIVLDNAETLIDAVEANDANALTLVELLKQLPSSSVSLLVTSRVPLDWAGEVLHELGGLTPKEGAELFQLCVPQRRQEVARNLTWDLSEQIGGHPLSIRLLGGAFNVSKLSLSSFIAEYEAQLLSAEDKYSGLDDRHRSLYACIEISVRYLTDKQRQVLSGLFVFHAPFLADMAVAIFDPENKESEGMLSHVRTSLHQLWHRSLLTTFSITTREDTMQFYYLLPATRPYLEAYLQPSSPKVELLARFGDVYARLAYWLHQEYDRSPTAVIIAQQAETDLERSLAHLTGTEQGYTYAYVAQLISRLGAPRRSLTLAERALEQAQEQDQRLIPPLLNNLAVVYQSIGQLRQALSLFEQALPITREIGERGVEATTLSNLAVVYNDIGQPQRALSLYEQALLLGREVGNRAGEATTLTNLAAVYNDIGQPQQALSLYEQALHIQREMGGRAGEATILTNLAGVYRNTGQPLMALSLLEQALPIRREIEDPAGEAATLSVLAGIYKDIGQPQRSLSLYEQVLLISREVGNRAEEAITLNNLAWVYRSIGQSQRALSLFEQALPIRREVGDRSGEATTLTNLAEVYHSTGQLQQARSLCEQALLLRREVGDRAGEAITLNNLAAMYQGIGQPQQAISFLEQALSIQHEVGDHAKETATLHNLATIYQEDGRYQEAETVLKQALELAEQIGDPAVEAAVAGRLAYLLYNHLYCTSEAVSLLERARTVLVRNGLPRDAAGNTPEQIQQWLQAINRDE